jgi:hypothetical protein
MSKTLTVKELITKLLCHDMSEPVYIGLGPNSKPDGSAAILDVIEWESGITCGFGVYLNPRNCLVDRDSYWNNLGHNAQGAAK